MDDLHLVPVVTGVSDFEAKCLAAQLGADGILWQTRGIVDSIYPFGGIDVLVPDDQLDDARQVLALVAKSVAAEVASANAAAALADEPPTDPPEATTGRVSWWLGVVATGTVVAVSLVRMLAIG